MNRRDVIVILGASAFAGVHGTARAQTYTKQVAVLAVPPLSDPVFAANWTIFVEALRDHGWVEGQNIRFERRSAEGRNDLLPKLAEELIALRPDVIVTSVSETTRLLQEKTSTIPIVMTAGPDPIAAGFISSLSRPGGNITGVTLQGGDTYGKVLQTLIELRPQTSRVQFYWNPASPGSRLARESTEAAASRLGVTVDPGGAVQTGLDLDAVFADTSRNHPDAVVVSGNPLLRVHSRRIAEFAIKQGIPAVSGWTTMTREGLLLSISPRSDDMLRRAAAITDKVLRGNKPSEIPVERPTRFELVVNMNTAKALGLTVPPSILARANEVLE